MHVAVVMPARNEEELIESSIKNVPDIVDCLIVVDDGSIDSTSKIADNVLGQISSQRSIITQCISGNGDGVGAAILLGVSYIIEIVDSPEEWAVVVMAGDGQMDPNDITNLISSLDSSDHVKGNRFHHISGIKNMPIIRRIASKVIGILTSLATGWRWGDPQCGYTATRLSLLMRHPRLLEWKGYGYPNWWALCFAESSECVTEVPVRSVYGSEKSGIRILSFFPRVSFMLLVGTWRRGWSWYVQGKGKRKAQFGIRILVTLFWFSSWFSLIYSIFNFQFLLMSILMFIFVRILDSKEQEQRTRCSTRFEM